MNEESKLTRLSDHAQRKADELRRHEDEDRRRQDREWEEVKDDLVTLPNGETKRTEELTVAEILGWDVKPFELAVELSSRTLQPGSKLPNFIGEEHHYVLGAYDDYEKKFRTLAARLRWIDMGVYSHQTFEEMQSLVLDELKKARQSYAEKITDKKERARLKGKGTRLYYARIEAAARHRRWLERVRAS